MIPYSEIKGEKLFTHITPDGTRIRTYAIDRILKDRNVRMLPIVIHKLSHEYGAKLLTSGLVNSTRLMLILRNKSVKLSPLIFARNPNGELDFIDGFERYVALLRWGTMQFEARYVPQSLWSKYVVTNLPYTDAELLAMAQGSDPSASTPLPN